MSGRPQIFDQVMPRLHTFMAPFVETFQGPTLMQQAKTSVCGLLSDVERKNSESIAYRFGQSRLPLQGCIGWEEWDEAPLRSELIRQVKTHLGTAAGVLVFDPSGFPKSGRESVGVAQQWCGRLGKVDNCQVAIYLGYVSRKGHILVDLRLYLPKEWSTIRPGWTKPGYPPPAEATARGTHWPWRCWRAMVPRCRMAGLPVTMRRGGRTGFAVGWRRWGSGTCWRCLRIRCVVIWRARCRPQWPGRRPQRPWRVAVWSQGLDEEAWQRIDVRDGSKGHWWLR